MVTVELFMNLPFNGSTKMSNFADAQAQETYFSSVPSTDKLVLTDVKFTNLSSPILLEKSIDDLYPYTYGRIKLNPSNSGEEYTNWYYFSIDRYEVERTDKTWVFYIIDYWETYRYSHTSGSTNKLTLGRARISRCDKDLSCRIREAFSKQFTHQSKLSDIDAGPENPYFPVWYNAIATYHDNSDNKDYILTLASLRRVSDLIAFNWVGAGIDPNQIMGLWFSPFPVTDVGAIIWTDTGNTTTFNIALYKQEFSTFAYMRESGQSRNEYEVTIPEQPSERARIGITDALGNLVWTSDIDPIGPNLKVCLNVTMTTCRWMGYVQRNNVYTYGECMFTIPCEPMDLFSDAFVSYYSQQRPFTEQQRAIQRDEAVVNGVTNTVMSAGQGGMLGAIGKTPVTSVAGAVIGAATGLVSTAIQYYTADDFNKRYQRNEDAQARMQTDNLRLEGCGLLDYAVGYTHPSFVKIECDPQSWLSYQQDIWTYGYFYDCEYNQMENLLQNNPTLKITCQCEIENVPGVAERSVKNRLSAGVEFIRP